MSKSYSPGGEALSDLQKLHTKKEKKITHYVLLSSSFYPHDNVLRMFPWDKKYQLVFLFLKTLPILFKKMKTKSNEFCLELFETPLEKAGIQGVFANLG